jgi:hypothetical protein
MPRHRSGAMGLQIEAEVEQRLMKHAFGAQVERDQHAADAAVAVEERVKGFELHMEEPRLDER